MATAEETAAAQAVLVGTVSTQVNKLWVNVNLNDLANSLPLFIQQLHDLVRRYSITAGVMARQQYLQARKAAHAPGAFTPRLAQPVPVKELEAGVKWATKGLWTTNDPNLDAAKQLVSGVVEKHVLDAGRGTLFNAIQSDKEAKGWARVPEPGACSFCLLLATRGAVYKNDSFKDSNRKFLNHSSIPSEFKVHDNCRCHVEPLFGTSYEATAQVRAAEQIYTESTRGKSGADARNAFRRAVEQRDNPAA